MRDTADFQDYRDYQTLLSWAGTQTDGLGRLLGECGGPARLLQSSDERLAELPLATQRVVQNARRHWPKCRSSSRYVAGSSNSSNSSSSSSASTASDTEFDSRDASFIPLCDPRYPPRLRALYDPPPWLFCQGDPSCLDRPAVAIVGSRRASDAGLRAATFISERLAAAGYTVCSGLALGIDAAAHRGALRSGYTAAVLASGLDRASPLQHRRLAQAISGRGCVLTELPPGTPPSKHQFPRRNRIISGLASATIIIEAALPSGSLHTAAAALEQGREVYTLPWSIFHVQGAGCLSLLRDGATPITGMDDLPSLFPGVSIGPVRRSERKLPTGASGELIRLIGDTPMSVATLQRKTGRDSGALLVLLGELELAGWLRRVGSLYELDSDGPC